MDFDANDYDTSVADSKGSCVPDTPTANSNPGRSKYGHTYRCTLHYNPATGHTIDAEATVLAIYYQCLKETDGKIELANAGAGIGRGFENTMELKPMKHKETINGLDGEAWAIDL